MNSHQRQFQIFVLVQSAFMLLDLFELWRTGGKPHLAYFLRAHRRLVFFLFNVWAAYFAIQNLLLMAMPSPETMLADFAATLALPTVGQTSPADLWSYALVALFLLFTYFTAALFDYVIHRWLLHHRRWWFLHESHHLPKVVFNGMPGISLRPYSAVSVFLTYAGTSAATVTAIKLTNAPWLFGWYLANLPLLMLLFTSLGSASHSLFLRRYWVVHRSLRWLFLTTPQEHILHHATEGNCNYGNFASVWDRIFGTYIDPQKLRGKQLEIGLSYEQDFLGALCGGKWKLPAAFRRKYQLAEVCNLTNDKG